MADIYRYIARDSQGKKVQGEIESDSLAGAAARLRQENYFIVKIEKKASNIWTSDLLNFDLWKNLNIKSRKVSLRELALFCRQFSTMINAGLPLMTCFHVLQDQSTNAKLKQAILGVIDELQEGNTLAEACGKFPGVFPPLFINLIEAGETGGVLDEVLERLAAHFEKEHELREKVKSAVTYPAAILLVAVGGVSFLMAFVMPMFENLLSSFNVELPLLTRIIMGFSAWLRQYWWLYLVGLGVTGFGLNRFMKRESSRMWWDEVSLKLPVFGQLFSKMIVARFSRNLGILLKSGVPVLQALEVVRKIAGNRKVIKAVISAQQSIREGQSIAGPLQESKVFPPMVIQMIAVGEETGALDSLLEKVAVFYEREIDALVARLSSLIEPVLIVGMGIMLGVLIVSVMLPITTLFANIGTQ